MAPMNDMSTMDMAALPIWARLGWAVVMLLVGSAHGWHAAVMSGQWRWWHIGHTAMAVAMTVMFVVAQGDQPTLFGVLAGVFGVVTAAEAIAAFAPRVNGRWLLAAVEMLAMTYMLLPGEVRPVALNWAVVVLLALDALAWLTGVSGRAAVREAVPSGAGGTAVARRTVALDVRISMAVMLAGMAVMLAAM